MADSTSPKAHTYAQGHSSSTISTHLLRTAEVEGAFLLPHLKPDSLILDVGCGPGTITTGFAKHVPQGRIVGIDNAPAVLEKARSLAASSGIPTSGPGSVSFEEGDVLKTLSYDDNTFDVVYASQTFGHFAGDEWPVHALKECRRVLKPGGILATRDGAATHFYPSALRLDHLWTHNLTRAIHKGEPPADRTGNRMPELMRLAGFDADAGKVKMGFATSSTQGQESRSFLAQRAQGQLREGEALYQSWLDAGVSEEEVQECLVKIKEWEMTQDAYLVQLQCEMLAWK